MGKELDPRIARALRFTADKLARGYTPAQVKWMLMRDGVPERAAEVTLEIVGGKVTALRRSGARYRRGGGVLVGLGVGLALAAGFGLWGWGIAAIGAVVYVEGWLLT